RQKCRGSRRVMAVASECQERPLQGVGQCEVPVRFDVEEHRVLADHAVGQVVAEPVVHARRGKGRTLPVRPFRAHSAEMPVWKFIPSGSSAPTGKPCVSSLAMPIAQWPSGSSSLPEMPRVSSLAMPSTSSRPNGSVVPTGMPRVMVLAVTSVLSLVLGRRNTVSLRLHFNCYY